MRVALISVLGLLLVAGSGCKKKLGDTSEAAVAEAYALAINPDAVCTRIIDEDSSFAVCRMDGAVWKCSTQPVQCLKIKDITAERSGPAPAAMPMPLLPIDGGVP